MARKTVTGRPTTTPNKLREIRTRAGLNRAELAAAADLVELTLRRIEKGHPSKASTRYRILNALNRLARANWSYREVFPNDPEVDE
jgi:DNA-binding XRE family transcriptional regulator